MFKKVHLRLTLLFTFISSLIIIVMTVCYLYIAEESLKENAFLSFRNDSNTIFTNLENRSVISYEWISKLEANGIYQIFILDNNIPLSYSSRFKTNEQRAVLDEALLSAQNHLSTSMDATYSDFSFRQVCTEFTSSPGDFYYLSYAKIPAKTGYIQALLLFPLETLAPQILSQRIHFLLIDICALFIISIFSFFFTKQLLKPIAENTKRQVQFISAASHELKAPLTVISSTLSALRKSDSQKEAFLHIAEEETVRMTRLLDDMLLLANSDNHTWSIQKEAVELDTLLLNCYESFASLAKKEGNALCISLPEYGIPSCFCDKQRIMQVLFILLDNAICYTPKEGIISLSLVHQNDHFQITVADNGIGIPHEQKPYIFDRFYRCDDARSQKGHFGLGLCIAKEIIDAHHGNISVSDTSNGGSTFCITLP